MQVYNARTRQVAAATQFDADMAVVAPEGVAFDEFYDYFADALPPAEAGGTAALARALAPYLQCDGHVRSPPSGDALAPGNGDVVQRCL